MGNFDQLVAQVGNAMGTVWNAWQTQWSGVTVSRQQEIKLILES